MSTSPKTQAQPAMWCAISRSGVINVRKGTGEYAVDVATRGMPANRTHRIFRVFTTAAAAQGFADACNAGKHPDAKLAPKLYDAIVVPAWPVPAEGKPWPWETPAGKRKLNAARKGRKAQPKAPRPRSRGGVLAPRPSTSGRGRGRPDPQPPVEVETWAVSHVGKPTCGLAHIRAPGPSGAWDSPSGWGRDGYSRSREFATPSPLSA